ncbi:single-stranded DNA-binding protein 3-like isoform X2 [Montipora capricornis]|uniref:single-stranded DNA-binding protein 3-like isoform X2 n=1 Tax=Montipora capricornis TaxID=246305 RepID=UPI0035F1266D
MRPPPNSSLAPGVNMPMPGSRPWNPTTSVAGPPGTPIMASPQDPASTGSESMYAMMKSVPGESIPAYMGGGPEPPLPLGAQEAPLVMNDSNPDMDGLPKDNQNDHNPGTPGEGDGQFGNLLPFSQDNEMAHTSGQINNMLFSKNYHNAKQSMTSTRITVNRLRS